MKKTYGSVVVTFNRKDLLMEAIQSLLDQTIKPKKIIIVDNASTDGTISELVEKFDVFNQDIFDMVELPENIGGAGGFKAGLDRCKLYNFDYVSVSDDDAMYQKDYFEKILDYAEENPSVRALCGKVMYEDSTIQLSHKRRVLHSKSLLDEKIVSGEEYKRPTFSVDAVSFVGLVIDVSLISEIGLPLEEYFIWLDDFEYSLRIRSKTEIICLTDAVIVHKTAFAADNHKYQYTWKEYYGIRNQIDLVKRHTKHPVVSKLALEWKFWSRLAANYVKPKYASYRSIRSKTLRDAYRDGKNGKIGKNLKYFPN
ncbi:glycosyltransferase [Enterococcus sp. FR202]|uniref:glycosyltransferase n=1 Tax=Enterococcus TaxID=1350 RepID=UPI00189A4FF1|nr:MULTISPECIES: glycosyltransferase [Enterococcus]MCR9047115.1 glycosyltransferase [Enterococcus faecium]MDQ8605841.1 glycosyltransferase [Enterococcus sp. FR202]MDQ8628948.1 glycosyltransferase [Enterococcus sp. FR204]MDQ8660800.1 glycosyltransferase [Enterococcus sp. FR205]MDQ8668287.1 glycosyltransferase [Enterococcus sp. FR203]